MDQRENQEVVNTVTIQATHRVNMPPRRDVVTHIQAYPWGHPKEPDYWTGVYSTMRSPTRPQAAPCDAFWALIESPAQPARGRNTGPRAAPEAHVNMAGKTGFDGPGENHKTLEDKGKKRSRQDQDVRALPYWQSNRKLARPVDIRIGTSCRSGSRWPGNASRCQEEFAGSVTIFGRPDFLFVRTDVRHGGGGTEWQALLCGN